MNFNDPVTWYLLLKDTPASVTWFDLIVALGLPFVGLLVVTILLIRELDN